MTTMVKTRERSISERRAVRRASEHHSGRRKKRQALLYDPQELRLLQKQRKGIIYVCTISYGTASCVD